MENAQGAKMTIHLARPEAVDFRKGIDGLARVCREQLQSDPFSGRLYVFRNRRRTAIKLLAYDGQGFWLAQKRLSKGRFRWWPAGLGGREVARSLEAHQLQVLLAGLAAGERAKLKKKWRGGLRSSRLFATLRGMASEFRYRSQVITTAQVEFIRHLIGQHPGALLPA